MKTSCDNYILFTLAIAVIFFCSTTRQTFAQANENCNLANITDVELIKTCINNNHNICLNKDAPEWCQAVCDPMSLVEDDDDAFINALAEFSIELGDLGALCPCNSSGTCPNGSTCCRSPSNVSGYCNAGYTAAENNICSLDNTNCTEKNCDQPVSNYNFDSNDTANDQISDSVEDTPANPIVNSVATDFVPNVGYVPYGSVQTSVPTTFIPQTSAYNTTSIATDFIPQSFNYSSTPPLDFIPGVGYVPAGTVQTVGTINFVPQSQSYSYQNTYRDFIPNVGYVPSGTVQTQRFGYFIPRPNFGSFLSFPNYNLFGFTPNPYYSGRW